MKLRVRTEKVIDCSDWDKLVQETYSKPYCFQQQGGCQSRGTFPFSVPSEETYDDEQNDEIPENTNHDIMGVKFAKWLERDPKQPLADKDGGNEQWLIDLWWERNFYPDFQTVANDLHAKGLLEAGDYLINISW